MFYFFYSLLYYNIEISLSIYNLDLFFKYPLKLDLFLKILKNNNKLINLFFKYSIL